MDLSCVDLTHVNGKPVRIVYTLSFYEGDNGLVEAMCRRFGQPDIVLDDHVWQTLAALTHWAGLQGDEREAEVAIIQAKRAEAHQRTKDAIAKVKEGL
jgi:hypothetical protein